jgi:hypothetical protein
LRYFLRENSEDFFNVVVTDDHGNSCCLVLGTPAMSAKNSQECTILCINMIVVDDDDSSVALSSILSLSDDLKNDVRWKDAKEKTLPTTINN